VTSERLDLFTCDCVRLKPIRKQEWILARGCYSRLLVGSTETTSETPNPRDVETLMLRLAAKDQGEGLGHQFSKDGLPS
jgi:hypothetical protein